MSFLSKAFKKISHVANGVVHAADSVAHSHVFQVVAGAAAIVFPPVGVPLAAGVAAVNVAHAAAPVVHDAGHAAAGLFRHAAPHMAAPHPGIPNIAHSPEVRAALGHVIDAADHTLNALNSKVAAHAKEAHDLIEHTKKIAAAGHVGAQQGLLVLYRRAAARKVLQNFHVDPHTARVVDKTSGQPASLSPHVNLGLH